MQFNYDKVPQSMKDMKRWCLWRLVEKDGRMTKVPIDALTGYGAKSNDERTWTTYEVAKANCDLYNCKGLGFMLGKGVFGVDLDHLDLDNEEDINLANDFSQNLGQGVYIEYSQSGTGLHFICKGELPQGARRKGTIEMYDSSRFFALTGNTVNGKDLSNLELENKTKQVKFLHNKYLCNNVIQEEGSYVFQKQTQKTVGERIVLSDSEILEKAQNAANGSNFKLLFEGMWDTLYPSQSEGDYALCSMLAFWTGKDPLQMDRLFRQSALMRNKWDRKSQGGNSTYGNDTIETAILNCVNIYQPSKKKDDERQQNEKTYDLTDTGNAERFIDKFGKKIRYNFDNKCWVIYDGKTWKQDSKQMVKVLTDILIEEMKNEAVKEPNEKWQMELFKNIKRLASNSGKEAMLKEAMHIGRTATTNADYDQDKYLLNCKNGIIDLRTGTLLKHDMDYMLSKNTGVDVDLNNTKPERWIKFLKEIFKDNKDLVRFVYKAVGYSLTGDTSEQCFFQCYGTGSNGKSVFLNIVSSIMGDYSINAQVESILSRSNQAGGASNDIARMNGARMVRTNEPNEGARFNEGLVKQLTSGDVTTARYLYGNEFEFIPVFKMWIACNYKINIRGTDDGIWRRNRLIPFTEQFKGDRIDRQLEDKLRLELPQILGFFVKGCLLWQKEGLELPDVMKEEQKQYQNEMDKIAQFIDAHCIEQEGAMENANDIYKEYVEWTKLSNEYRATQTKFGIEMGKKYEKKKYGGNIFYVGIKLKKHDRSYVYMENK